MFRIIRRTIHLTRPLPAQTALDFDDIPTRSLYEIMRSPKLHEYVKIMHREHGPIYRDNIGSTKVVFVCDPELMRDVFIHEGKYPDRFIPEPWLVYNENEKYGFTRGLTLMIGEEWMHFRKILNRILLKVEQKWIDDVCRIVCTKMIVRLKELNQDNVVIPDLELERELYEWVIYALIGILVGEKQYTESLSLIESNPFWLPYWVRMISYTASKLSPGAAYLSRYKMSRWKSFVREVHNALCDTRYLLEELKNPKSDGLLQKLVDEGVSDDDIVRIVTDLAIAAGETTVNSMKWIIYCLAKHPEVQKQYLEYPEQQQQFRRHILKETLRLYPVVPFLTRYMPNDVVIGGYSIPKKTLMVVSLYPACRNELYFNYKAATFWPYRWLREDSDHHDRFIMQQEQATIPFAVGTRSCIGKKLAETQLQMLTGMLIDNFEIELRNLDEIDLVMNFNMLAVPSKPFELVLRERKT